MQIRFWGVRGSVASPGPRINEYGGNTSCIEVKEGGVSLIFDAGTGLRNLGNHLLRGDNRGSSEISLFLSHFHIDHLCGLPFFRPLFERGRTIHLYGPKGYGKSFRQILSAFFSKEFFPVPLSRIPARLTFLALGEGSIRVSPFRVDSFYINHPGYTLGYVISSKKLRIGYLCDHEPIDQYRHLKRENSKQYQRRLITNLQGIDLLIHDATYTDRQYPTYKGWGHSPWSYAVRLAEAAGVKRLALFHYAPENEDPLLKAAFRSLQQRLALRKSRLRVMMAREGTSVRL